MELLVHNLRRPEDKVVRSQVWGSALRISRQRHKRVQSFTGHKTNFLSLFKSDPILKGLINTDSFQEHISWEKLINPVIPSNQSFLLQAISLQTALGAKK